MPNSNIVYVEQAEKRGQWNVQLLKDRSKWDITIENPQGGSGTTNSAATNRDSAYWRAFYRQDFGGADRVWVIEGFWDPTVPAWDYKKKRPAAEGRGAWLVKKSYWVSRDKTSGTFVDSAGLRSAGSRRAELTKLANDHPELRAAIVPRLKGAAPWGQFLAQYERGAAAAKKDKEFGLLDRETQGKNFWREFNKQRNIIVSAFNDVLQPGRMNADPRKEKDRLMDAAALLDGLFYYAGYLHEL